MTDEAKVTIDEKAYRAIESVMRTREYQEAAMELVEPLMGWWAWRMKTVTPAPSSEETALLAAAIKLSSVFAAKLPHEVIAAAIKAGGG